MGIAIHDGSFKLRDDEGKLVEETDKMGELVYHGKNIMLGYAVQGADLAKGDEMQDTLATGDLAKRDEEDFYTIVGRKKRFLKMFGKRTNMEEVEHLLRQHFGIADVACGGVDDHLYIFLAEKTPEQDIVPYISAKLGLHPSGFKVKKIEVIPKNEAGKTLYRELEQYYGQ